MRVLVNFRESRATNTKKRVRTSIKTLSHTAPEGDLVPRFVCGLVHGLNIREE